MENYSGSGVLIMGPLTVVAESISGAQRKHSSRAYGAHSDSGVVSEVQTHKELQRYWVWRVG